MSPRAPLAALLGLAIALTARPAVAQGSMAQGAQQELVDRATLAAEDMLNDRNGRDAQELLRHAHAVMICPRIFSAGFLFGAQGGGCVLSGSDGHGHWSPPAFYDLGGASFGFQAGMQDSSLMMFILNPKSVLAVMDNQFKIGADAGATFIDWGGGVEGATTAALSADIVAFSRSRGLFAGISLGGSVLSARTDFNQAYYGRVMAAQQIVLTGEGNNPGADPLRQVLARAGRARDDHGPLASAVTADDRLPPSDMPQPMTPAPTGSVNATPLAPPRR